MYDIFRCISCSRCYNQVVQAITSSPVLVGSAWSVGSKHSGTAAEPNSAKYTLRPPPQLMPSLARYIRGIRAVGIKEWWHQMQYIGDVKAGTFVGSDQYVAI
jgi:hypothetical protein